MVSIMVGKEDNIIVRIVQSFLVFFAFRRHRLTPFTYTDPRKKKDLTMLAAADIVILPILFLFCGTVDGGSPDSAH
jgi:hypothetical protein